MNNNTDCTDCKKCKCKEKGEKLKKAQALLKKKTEKLNSADVVKKTIMPNGNIHFEKV